MCLKKVRYSHMILKGLFGLMVSMMLLGLTGVKARAAESAVFHQHDSTCYTRQWVQCKDVVKVTHYNQDFYCNGCQKISSAIVMVETYICADGSGSREYKSTGYCCNCPTVVYTKEVSATEVHSKWANVCTCGMTDSTVVAKVDFTATTDAWTNQDVIISAKVTEPISGVSLAPYEYAFSGGVADGTKCIVSENGNYSVTVTASGGQQMTASLQVNNIDKASPQIIKCYADKEYPVYDSASLVIEAADELSGLADEAYSFDGGATFVAPNRFQISSNGDYSIVVKDKAGNCCKQTVKVSCFAKKAEPAKPAQNTQTVQSTNQVSKPHGITIGNSLKNGNVDKEKTVKKGEKSETETTEAYTQLKEKLEQSDFHVPLDKIPGIYSSLMRSNAEKNAVPMTLNVVNEKTQEVYSAKMEEQENLVKNISINSENAQRGGTFAQVTKATVCGGVLLCIGMMTFLIVFLVKKQ